MEASEKKFTLEKSAICHEDLVIKQSGGVVSFLKENAKAPPTVSAVVFMNGQLFNLNISGLLIWEMINKHDALNIGDLSAHLRATFAKVPLALEDVIDSFLQQGIKAGLIHEC